MAITDWSMETWLGLSVFVTGSVAGVIAAVAKARKPREREVERSFGPKPHLFRLSDEDRDLIERSTDRMSDALRAHREAIRAHGDVIRDLKPPSPPHRR